MDILYHYCSTDTLVSIVNNRTIRLSLLTLSNDSHEGRIIYDQLLQLGRNSGFLPDHLCLFERYLRWSFEFFEGFGFCLSEKGDLLSQWRGYADNGLGVSIGFNRLYLEKLGELRRSRGERNFHLHKAEYDEQRHKAIAREHFEKIKSRVEEHGVQPPEMENVSVATRQLRMALFTAAFDMFDVKGSAFSEEQEWRLMNFSLSSPEGAGNKFRACTDKVVPYLDIAMEDVGLNPIEHVILGPKHKSPLHIIGRLLKNSGFGEVRVSNSAVTYR